MTNTGVSTYGCGCSCFLRISGIAWLRIAGENVGNDHIPTRRLAKSAESKLRSMVLIVTATAMPLIPNFAVSNGAVAKNTAALSIPLSMAYR